MDEEVDVDDESESDDQKFACPVYLPAVAVSKADVVATYGLCFNNEEKRILKGFLLFFLQEGKYSWQEILYFLGDRLLSR